MDERETSLSLARARLYNLPEGAASARRVCWP